MLDICIIHNTIYMNYICIFVHVHVNLCMCIQVYMYVLLLFFPFFFDHATHTACEILVPRPALEPGPRQ